jgi:hypothetical protein
VNKRIHALVFCHWWAARRLASRGTIGICAGWVSDHAAWVRSSGQVGAARHRDSQRGVMELNKLEPTKSRSIKPTYPRAGTSCGAAATPWRMPRGRLDAHHRPKDQGLQSRHGRRRG